MPSNLPDPGRIPDMSLGERDDRPVPPVHADPKYSYQPPPAHEVQFPPTPTDSPGSSPVDWQEGDRVLAPWEPMFLYAGTIKQIRLDEDRGDQARIEFDDGDEGWVYLYSLSPLQLKAGQRIFCRRRTERFYHAAEILEVGDGEAHVEFDTGGSEWTTLAALRIPCVENGPGAAAKFGSYNFSETLEPPGSGVPSWVIWVGIWVLLAVLRVGCRSVGQ